MGLVYVVMEVVIRNGRGEERGKTKIRRATNKSETHTLL